MSDFEAAILVLTGIQTVTAIWMLVSKSKS